MVEGLNLDDSSGMSKPMPCAIVADLELGRPVTHRLGARSIELQQARSVPNAVDTPSKLCKLLQRAILYRKSVADEERRVLQLRSTRFSKSICKLSHGSQKSVSNFKRKFQNWDPLPMLCHLHPGIII